MTEQSNQFSELVESAAGHRSCQAGEPNLRLIHERVAASDRNDQHLEFEVSFEEAFDLVQSLTACWYAGEWPTGDRQVLDNILDQLARNPFPCCCA